MRPAILRADATVLCSPDWGRTIAPIAARGSRGKGRLSVRSPCQGHKRKKKRDDAALGGPERRRRMSPRHASSPGERVGVARPSEKPPRSGHARAGSADGSPLPGCSNCRVSAVKLRGALRCGRNGRIWWRDGRPADRIEAVGRR
jgi:hypothetical protein